MKKAVAFFGLYLPFLRLSGFFALHFFWGGPDAFFPWSLVLISTTGGRFLTARGVRSTCAFQTFFFGRDELFTNSLHFLRLLVRFFFQFWFSRSKIAFKSSISRCRCCSKMYLIFFASNYLLVPLYFFSPYERGFFS